MTCYHWSANLFLLVFDHGWSSERDRNDVTIDRTGNAMSLPRARLAFIRANKRCQVSGACQEPFWQFVDMVKQKEIETSKNVDK